MQPKQSWPGQMENFVKYPPREGSIVNLDTVMVIGTGIAGKRRENSG